MSDETRTQEFATWDDSDGEDLDDSFLQRVAAAPAVAVEERLVIGPYRLLETLGRGGMGLVYRAQHGRTGEQVALKTVLRAPRPGRLQSLRREIHALARIRHPDIVRIVESGLEDGLPWYAMELVEGQPLLEAARKLGRSDALSLVRRLCVPLAYLHGEGIVHRDLKPGNILVRPNGRPVLVDFGLAAHVWSELSREALELSGSVSGTLGYMAPEQLRNELVDARADLYALGCILYELLTGRRPFEARSHGEFLVAHQKIAPAPPSTLAPNVPPQLDHLVLRLLRSEPSLRLGYADDVVVALSKLGAADTPNATAPRPRPYLYRPGLAGRSEPLTRLEAELARLETGAGGLLLVAGESGAGKTRLALELGRRAVSRGITVLTGECTSSVDVALGPLRKTLQAVADRCQEGGPKETERLLGPRGKLLARYEPALAGLPGQAAHPEPSELPIQEARLQLFSYLTDTFIALTGVRPASAISWPTNLRTTPVLLILDDLQWSDELSLGWLEFLLSSGHLDQIPLMVVGTHRVDETGRAGGQLPRLLESTPGGTQAKRFLLGPLDQMAIGTMVSDMLALPSAPVALVGFLSRLSMGNPFFVAEYLQMAIAEKVLHRDAEAGWQLSEPGRQGPLESVYRALPLPRSLHELVRRRLNGLPPLAQRLVDVASVIGGDAELGLVRDILQVKDDELMDALADLSIGRMLESSASGRLHFLHDQLREVAYREIDHLHRQRLHLAVAGAMEAAVDAEQGEHMAALGHHWEQGGVRPKARVAYLAGARRAVARYVYGQAEQLYRQGLDLIDAPTREGIRARIELARDVLSIQGRNLEALSELLRAAEETQLFEDRRLKATVLLGLARVQHVTGMLPAALTSLEQALGLYQQLGDRQSEGTTLSNFGQVYVAQGRLEEARSIWVQALAIHREARDLRGEARTLSDLAQLHLIDQSKVKQARILFKEALRTHQLAGDRIGEGITLFNLGGALREAGKVEEAKDCFRQALTIHREVGHRRYEAYTLCDQAKLEREAYNDLNKAEQLLDEATTIAREVQDPFGQAFCLCERAHIDMAKGRSAWRLLIEARRVAERADAGPRSDLGRSVAKLEAAVLAFEANEPLFRGDRRESFPEGLMRWLQRQGA